MLPTKKSSAPIQKEWPALSLAAGEERGPNPKGVAGSHKVMERGCRWWYGDVVVGNGVGDGEEMVVEFGEEVVEKMEFG